MTGELEEGGGKLQSPPTFQPWLCLWYTSQEIGWEECLQDEFYLCRWGSVNEPHQYARLTDS